MVNVGLLRLLALWLAGSLAGAAWAQAAAAEAPAAASAPRPRIGLVLSGGGARGLAHVGVLKVLEREGVVIDLIAGTSMGAIIGGLYASGMGAAEIEAELLKVDWDALFASRVERRELTQRRKEEDFEIATAIEFGLRDGELRAPLGALSGRGLETLLRRYTLPVRDVRNFDALPIPFRAVATDMESGARVVLGDGDLALALRSSMSIPGVFAPTELNGRILGDGGLVDNLPVQAVRAMGADLVIAVNIGTPLAGRDALTSVSGLTAQMLNILTEQNVQASLAALGGSDVLIRPDLGALGPADFARAGDLIALGEQGAEPHAVRLAALGVGAARHAAWRERMPPRRLAPARVDFVQFEGSERTQAQRLAGQLETRAGEAFDSRKAERDARRLAASGDYLRADYRLVGTADGEGVVFELDDKPWGPHYFRIGLDLSTDFRGASAFNIKLSHNLHWLDANGSEWRNRVQIGEEPRWFTEWYRPLNRTIGTSSDWFVAAHADIGRREIVDFDNASGNELARYKRKATRFGFDLGQPWGSFGELRLGLVHSALHDRVDIVALDAGAVPDAATEVEYGLRLAVVVDQLDFASFPQRGFRIAGEAVSGFRRDAAAAGRERINRIEASVHSVGSIGRHTLNAYALVQHAAGSSDGRLGRYTLGGFQQLSGYRPGQLDGNAVAFARLVYYQRRAEVPLLTRGLFIGASLEAGNVWPSLRQASASELRSGGSLFVGADTGIGPLYLGLTYAPRGAPGIVLFIGRP